MAARQPSAAATAAPVGGRLLITSWSTAPTSSCAQNTTGDPGGQPGSGGRRWRRQVGCTLTPLSQQQATFLGLQWPPPKGDTWEAITCPGDQPFGGVTLVDNATGAPRGDPAGTVQIAIGELNVPELPQPQTAPPRGRDGLVGPAGVVLDPGLTGARCTVTVAVGPVWARATAVPEQITFNPGGGPARRHLRGPGTAYRPALPRARSTPTAPTPTTSRRPGSRATPTRRR